MSADLDRNVLLVVAAASVAMAAMTYTDNHLFPEPYHTSLLLGHDYVQELLKSTNIHHLPDVLGLWLTFMEMSCAARIVTPDLYKVFFQP